MGERKKGPRSPQAAALAKAGVGETFAGSGLPGFPEASRVLDVPLPLLATRRGRRRQNGPEGEGARAQGGARVRLGGAPTHPGPFPRETSEGRRLPLVSKWAIYCFSLGGGWELLSPIPPSEAEEALQARLL